MYKKPELDPRFFYGQILRYEFLGGITKDRGKYRFRLKIFYSTGHEVVTQRSGFPKKKDAERAKEQIIHDLINRTFAHFLLHYSKSLNTGSIHIVSKKIRLRTIRLYPTGMHVITTF